VMHVVMALLKDTGMLTSEPAASTSTAQPAHPHAEQADQGVRQVSHPKRTYVFYCMESSKRCPQGCIS